jgi:hypothetical protein
VNQRKQGRAFFAVKRKPSPSDEDLSLAPQLVAIVETYDDGIKLAERRNVFADGDPYYVAPYHC